MKNLLLIYFFLNLFLNLQAQKKSEFQKSLTEKDFSIFKKYLGAKFIEAGTFTYGHLPDNVKNSESDTFLLCTYPIESRVSVSSFYLGETEVTNAQYKEFLNWVRDSIAHSTSGSPDINKIVYASGKYAQNSINIYPDTLCWIRDFPYAYNEAMTHNYFSHPVFDDYPVVGVSWEQALAYCDWKSNQVNPLLRKLGYDEVEIRLPKEAEWELAASNYISKDKIDKTISPYPWPNASLFDKKGNYKANFGVINDENGIAVKEYLDNEKSGYLYTSKVKSFPPNNGLYDMAGNLDEWVLDRPMPGNYNRFRIEFQDSLFAQKVIERAKLSIAPEKLKEYYNSIIENKDSVKFQKLMQASFEEMFMDLQLQFTMNFNKDQFPEVLDKLVREFKILVTGEKRLAKGGSWASGLIDLCKGSKRAYSSAFGYSTVGFRIACSSVQKIK